MVYYTLEKPVLDKASKDRLKMLEKSDHKTLEAHMYSLTMDELLDEMVLLYRTDLINSEYKKSLIDYHRSVRWNRQNEEFKLNDSNRPKIIQANQNIINASTQLCNSFMKIVELRSKEEGEKRDYITGHIEWGEIDKEYTFGYSHPIDKRTFSDLCSMIYGDHEGETHAGCGAFEAGVTNQGITCPYTTPEDFIYPKLPEAPELKRSWNKLMGLEELTEARLCFPFWIMREVMLTFEDIFAIKEYEKIINILDSSNSSDK